MEFDAACLASCLNLWLQCAIDDGAVIMCWDIYAVKKSGGCHQAEALPAKENRPHGEDYLGTIPESLWE